MLSIVGVFLMLSVLPRSIGRSAARGGVRCVSTAHAQAAVELVEKVDYEHYAVGLFFPEHARPAYLAVRAYNAEVSTIRDMVHGNQLTGRMRFQFWRDALESIYEGKPVPQQPTAIALADACRGSRIGRQWLERCLNAKEADMEDQDFNNISDLEEYAEAAFSSLIYSSVECLGVEETGSINTAASHLGIAEGMITLLRGIPFTAAAEKRVVVPRWVMAKSNAKDEHFFDAASDPNAFGVEAKNAIFEIASVANSHLRAAHDLADELPQDVLPAFLPALIVTDYLDELEGADFNVFDPALRGRSKRGWHTLKFLWKMRQRSKRGMPFGEKNGE